MMFAGLYIEVNLICIAVIAIILLKVAFNNNLMSQHQLLATALFLFIPFFLSDIVWALIDNKIINAPVEINYLVNILYFSFSAICPFMSFSYCCGVQKSRLVTNKTIWGFMALPAVSIVILAINSPITKWIFYIDESNGYHRGKLYLLSLIVELAYVVITGIVSLVNSQKKENYAHKELYFSFTGFMLFPILASLGQLLLPGYPLTAVGITLATVNMYLSLIDTQVLTDPLTLLCNKRWFLNFNEMRFEEINNSENSTGYVLLLDVDGLIKINSKHGREEGNKALQDIAHILITLPRQTSLNGYFIPCRYGEDEFLVICEMYDGAKMDSVIKFINKKIEILNAKRPLNLNYKLSVSMGYAPVGAKNQHILKAIEEADLDMLKIKKQKLNSHI